MVLSSRWIAGVPGEKPQVTSDKLLDSPSKFPCIQLWMTRRIWHCIKSHLRPYSTHPFIIDITWIMYYQYILNCPVKQIQRARCGKIVYRRQITGGGLQWNSIPLNAKTMITSGRLGINGSSNVVISSCFPAGLFVFSFFLQRNVCVTSNTWFQYLFIYIYFHQKGFVTLDTLLLITHSFTYWGLQQLLYVNIEIK